MNNHNKASGHWRRLLLLGSTLALSLPLISCDKDTGSDDKKEEKAKLETATNTKPVVASNTDITKTAVAETKEVILNVFGMN